MTLYDFGTYLQLLIAACMFGCAYANLYDRRRNLWMFLLGLGIAIDQIYWSMARHATALSSAGWVKWEFEHSMWVVLIKGIILVAVAGLLFGSIRSFRQ